MDKLKRTKNIIRWRLINLTTGIEAGALGFQKMGFEVVCAEAASGETKATTMYSVRVFGNTCLLYSLDAVLRYGEVLNIPQPDERNRIVERKEVEMPLFHA